MIVVELVVDIVLFVPRRGRIEPIEIMLLQPDESRLAHDARSAAAADTGPGPCRGDCTG